MKAMMKVDHQLSECVNWNYKMCHHRSHHRSASATCTCSFFVFFSRLFQEEEILLFNIYNCAGMETLFVICLHWDMILLKIKMSTSTSKSSHQLSIHQQIRLNRDDIKQWRTKKNKENKKRKRKCELKWSEGNDRMHCIGANQNGLAHYWFECVNRNHNVVDHTINRVSHNQEIDANDNQMVAFDGMVSKRCHLISATAT